MIHKGALSWGSSGALLLRVLLDQATGGGSWVGQLCAHLGVLTPLFPEVFDSQLDFGCKTLNRKQSGSLCFYFYYYYFK